MPSPSARTDQVPSSSSAPLPDVQGARDDRGFAIDRVGVSDVRYPVTVRSASGNAMPSVATFSLFVSLPADRKGTHMSRFLEILPEHATDLSSARVLGLARVLRDRLDAEHAYVDAQLPYFINKLAPVTGAPGLIEYEVRLRAVAGPGGADDVELEVAAPATSLCPCSKEISEAGAHNQRCRIAAAVRHAEGLCIEDLAEILESAASCEVYSVLKRPDEKFVTEEAYKRPKFVEDIVRDLAGALEADERILAYRISSENYESIHGHNAYAEIDRDKRSG